MDKSNTITAPQSGDLGEIYSLWQESNDGTLDDFFEFWITPTAEREEFLDSLKMSVIMLGSVAITTYNSR